MSPFHRALIVGSLAAASPLFGVYAPIPEQPPAGKTGATFSVKGGVAHDSNVFGASSNEISSTIWTLAPRVDFKAEFEKNTTLGASYGLTLDQFDQRPGDKLLDSHEVMLAGEHKWSEQRRLSLSDALTVTRNPESLLSGVKLNTDQSFTQNQFDGQYLTDITGQFSATAKLRTTNFDYRDAALGRSLDRLENLYGLAANYNLGETKAVGEFRHQDIYFSKLGETKNKTSEYLMGGVDYEMAKRLSLAGRLGVEWRDRAAERNTTAPYAEFLATWYLGGASDKRSFVVGGLDYKLEETSDTTRFNDTQVIRAFSRVRFWVMPNVAVSASLNYEPSTLQGRRGQRDVDETTVRGGLGLSYLAPKNWAISATFDYDRVSSDDAFRNLQRTRVGLSAVYSF